MYAAICTWEAVLVQPSLWGDKTLIAVWIKLGGAAKKQDTQRNSTVKMSTNVAQLHHGRFENNPI